MKSRQTTPTTPPAFDAGSTACSEPFGTSVGGIAVRPSLATLPGWSGVFSTSVPPPVVCSEGVDGAALERTPGGLIASETTRPNALIAPWFGSCWYISRQVTPVANAEIAIGRNTTVLNATDQLTRSVSTAKIRPIAATNIGTTATQMALFLIAVVSVEVVNSAL